MPEIIFHAIFRAHRVYIIRCWFFLFKFSVETWLPIRRSFTWPDMASSTKNYLRYLKKIFWMFDQFFSSMVNLQKFSKIFYFQNLKIMLLTAIVTSFYLITITNYFSTPQILLTRLLFGSNAKYVRKYKQLRVILVHDVNLFLYVFQNICPEAVSQSVKSSSSIRTEVWWFSHTQITLGKAENTYAPRSLNIYIFCLAGKTENLENKHDRVFRFLFISIH